MTDESASDAADFLHRVFDDVELSYLIVVAAQLGVADLLVDGPRSVQELAAVTGVDATSLGRVLRALASRGLFSDEGGYRFSLTPLAEPLRQGAFRSVRPQALWSGTEVYRRTWDQLAHSVRTGEPAFDHVYGTPFFDHLASDPAVAKIFSDVMTSGTSNDSAAIAAAHDFSGYRRIVDVGGGHGALLAAILDRYQGPVGELFDLPHVLDAASGAIDEQISSGRLRKVAGDFSRSVPAGADAYLLKWIIHDWDDEPAINILTHCREAMAPEGKLFLIEVVVPQGDAGAAATRLDTTMLVFTGSGERTEHEYRQLLNKAGLALLHVTPTASNFSILEAGPA